MILADQDPSEKCDQWNTWKAQYWATMSQSSRYCPASGNPVYSHTIPADKFSVGKSYKVCVRDINCDWDGVLRTSSWRCSGNLTICSSPYCSNLKLNGQNPLSVPPNTSVNMTYTKSPGNSRPYRYISKPGGGWDSLSSDTFTAPATQGDYQVIINLYNAECNAFCSWNDDWYTANACPASSYSRIGYDCGGGCSATLRVTTITPTPTPTPTPTASPTPTPTPTVPPTNCPSWVSLDDVLRSDGKYNKAISWQNVANEDGYRILRCTGAGCNPTPPALTTVGKNVTSYTDTNNNNGFGPGTWVYEIRPFKDGCAELNCSDYPNVIATPTPTPTPTPTGAPSCTISLSPADLTLEEGGEGPQVASTSGTVNRVRFLSLDQRFACVYPVDSCVSLVDDSSLPYSTTIRGVSQGSTQIVGYAYLNPDDGNPDCSDPTPVTVAAPSAWFQTRPNPTRNLPNRVISDKIRSLAIQFNWELVIHDPSKHRTANIAARIAAGIRGPACRPR
ncbi:MAG: hypothetical protein H5T64_11990 [Chloroflexi bacterium]|nr:hypothetical protein [Chloroflexota bacterium]